MNIEQINLRRSWLVEAAEIARHCSSEATRERVLVSQSVALAVRDRLERVYNLPCERGRSSAAAKYVELLDVCDFSCAGRAIEVRTVTSVNDLALYIPTIPLMVGFLSDFYVCVQVDENLTHADVLGYVPRAALNNSQLTPNAMFAVCTLEQLKPLAALAENLANFAPNAEITESRYSDWDAQIEQIENKFGEVLRRESNFSDEQAAKLIRFLRDEMWRVTADEWQETGIANLLEKLYERFDVEKPVPSAPDDPILFRNDAKTKEVNSRSRRRERFFTDELHVSERVSLYRHLLENEQDLIAHQRTKQIFDRATEGKHQASNRRRTQLRSRRQIEQKRALIEPPLIGENVEDFLAGAAFNSNLFVQEQLPIMPDVPLDFAADGEKVRAVAEAIRLSYGHQYNPTYATETSLIDPLPHQRIAVYDTMLKESRMRFLLADDAGAGKTIMAGLYIREMLSRRLLRRILVVPPAGLAGNWERELRTLFGLHFRIVAGSEARNGNPFVGTDSDLLIVKLDTLRGDAMFKRLQEADVEPYDLVIFDEAHKLSADREPDLNVRKTDRYKLAEALAGIGDGEGWSLPWNARHLLLLTATPHQGKEFPYYSLWRLLEPEILPTIDAFNSFPPEVRRRHFIRRTKEEMVRFDGTRIYPARETNTFSYELTVGEASEQTLYDETTDYIRTYYNRARVLNRSAARLAMSVFQRRLASSTYALMLSLERRLSRVSNVIEAVKSGELSESQFRSEQRRLDKTEDVFETMTADEETSDNEREENQIKEEKILGAFVGSNLAELEAERLQVERLYRLAKRVYDDPEHEESKFAKLREVFDDAAYRNEKVLIFTEHRDTLDFLTRRFEGIGYAGQVAEIHGGMDYRERDRAVEFFRQPQAEGGARFLVATDAAGEGINLQFCWLMVNYDIPWNPARLEQRMGRIHRYGQKREQVLILNLIAGKTREGRVLKTLLEKLETIRKELGSEKVFDCIGRVFENVSLRQFMESALTGNDPEAEREQIEGKLTKAQVAALINKERILYGDGGDVAARLPELRRQLEREELRRLLPGYVRRFVEKTAPLLDLRIEGDLNHFFTLRENIPNALQPLQSALEIYAPAQMERITLRKPLKDEAALFLHPGEPVFERLRTTVWARFAEDARRGGIFLDPLANEPYLFALGMVNIVRRADENTEALNREELLESRLVGFKATMSGQISECEVESLMLLQSTQRTIAGFDLPVRIFAADSEALQRRLQSFAFENTGKNLVETRRSALLETLADRKDFLARGFQFQESDLLLRRQNLRERALNGDGQAKNQLEKVKEQQRRLAANRETGVAVIDREPALIDVGDVEFFAFALVVPSEDAESLRQHEREVEQTAMQVARVYEESFGATVTDVSAPNLAVAAGLIEHPGFDLLSLRADGTERTIEVKGRASVGAIELTENEWIKACNLGERYWLYVVYDCAGARPQLVRIQNPFAKLVVRAKGSVLVNQSEIFASAEE